MREGSSPSFGTNHFRFVNLIFGITMTLKNCPGLTVRVRDFNLVAKSPGLIKKLRRLTLNPYSGMNNELTVLLDRIKTRPVEAKVILGYLNSELVAWALLSKEQSDFWFINHSDGYVPSYGTLFEVYVDPNHRRKGIGSILLKAAKRKIGAANTLCICPWDIRSEAFFNNFKSIKHRKM
jgi:GNAT superfamily N-acetyltransferase